MSSKVTGNNANVESPAVNHRTIVGQNRRKKTESRIIEAAIQVFAEKGPEAPVIDDFMKAAGIARGTFYNYFNSTSELLTAASTWLADDLIESIEEEVKDIADPVIRHGVGIRLWMRKAKTDPAWCGFVTSVWFQEGNALDAPIRDIRQGMKSGEFSCPSAQCGWDMALGTIRQAMIRLMQEPKLIKTNYSDQIVRIILQGLGASPEKQDEVLAYRLPAMRRPTQTIV